MDEQQGNRKLIAGGGRRGGSDQRPSASLSLEFRLAVDVGGSWPCSARRLPPPGLDGKERIFGAQRCDLSEPVFWPLEEQTRLT